MAPSSMPSAGKKQQTLSSFFTPRNDSTGAPQSRRIAFANVQQNENKSIVKEDASNNNTVQGDLEEDGFELPPAKRTKVQNTDEDEDDGPLTSLQINPRRTNTQFAPNGVKAAKVTDRTSKYLFSSSPVEANGTGPREAVDDGEEKNRKEELHRRFMKKLGRPDSITEIKRRNRLLLENTTSRHAGDGEESDEEDENEDLEPIQKSMSKGRGSTSKKSSSSKLTPMEKQVVEIKRAHPDTLLVVEVGYKFRFFGEDARTAAKELGIVCIPGKFRFDEHPSEAHLDRFASASIPVHRLHVHVKRLVSANHKVGVVRQLETAALKAVGDNRNAPFVRKLTNLYTKGTYVDDAEGLIEGREGSPGPSVGPQSPATGFLLCLTETNVKGYGNDEKVHVGLLAVQPSTGDIIYDDFEDGFMRSEIETRLLHIAPCEFLIVGDLSKASEKLILHLSASKTNLFGDRARVERVEKKKTAAAMASSHVSSFYAEKMAEVKTQDAKAMKLLDKILGLPENVTICLSSMISHLTEYGLEHIFDLTKYFQPFSARSHMLLNGNTLSSLEIYQNQTDHTVKGSLFWTLDRTQTKFGSRLLRKWVGRPLLDKLAINERLDAVEELLDSENTTQTEKLRRVLGKTRVDLEKSLLRIYYGKCSRPELLNVLQSLQALTSEFASANSPAATGFQSSLISSAIMSLPSILPEVISYLDRINLHAAKADDKYSFFREDQETEAISNHRIGIASVEQDLDDFRSVAGEKLGRRRPVDYVTVAGISYLIEVDNSSATIKKVPASWAKISGTKKVSRFHPPEVVKMMRERDQHKESLAAACDAAFKDLLADISTKYQLFRDAVQGLGTLDVLLSLSTVAAQPGYTRPSFTDEKDGGGDSGGGVARVDVKGLRHPMIEQLVLDSYVPNDVQMDNGPCGTRALLVTGPNMGGKSSYVRSVALIAIMAQVGSFVPAEQAKLGILDAVFTRMGAFDNMLAGESTFMVELGETSEILRQVGDRSLVVLDELGRGTSTHDGVAIAGSVLDWLLREKRCLTLFITHYQVLARMAGTFSPQANNDGKGKQQRDEAVQTGPLKNVHMRFREDEDRETVTFLYEVGDGVAHRSYGLNVARLANIPEPVIARAGQKSRELEIQIKARRLGAVVDLLMARPRFSKNERLTEKEVNIDALIQGIEQL